MRFVRHKGTNEHRGAVRSVSSLGVHQPLPSLTSSHLETQHGAAKEVLQKKCRHCLDDGARTTTRRLNLTGQLQGHAQMRKYLSVSPLHLPGGLSLRGGLQ